MRTVKSNRTIDGALDVLEFIAYLAGIVAAIVAVVCVWLADYSVAWALPCFVPIVLGLLMFHYALTVVRVRLDQKHDYEVDRLALLGAKIED